MNSNDSYSRVIFTIYEDDDTVLVVERYRETSGAQKYFISLRNKTGKGYGFVSASMDRDAIISLIEACI